METTRPTILEDLINSVIHNNKEALPFNRGLIIIFNVSTIALMFLWCFMIWMLHGHENGMQVHAVALLVITCCLFVSFNWFVSIYESGDDDLQMDKVSEDRKDK